MSIYAMFAAAAQAGGTVAQDSVGAAAEQPAPRSGGFLSMLPLFIIFGVMIFLMMRSQKKQQQKRQQMLDRVTRGVRVMLGSGILGTVVEVRDGSYVVEIADKVKVEVVKSGIGEVLSQDAEARESK